MLRQFGINPLACQCPDNTGHQANVGVMLVQRRRWVLNIQPALCKRIGAVNHLRTTLQCYSLHIL